MYQCQNCETRYDLTKEHFDTISNECDRRGVATTIIICPGCHKARIIGAESDWDDIDEKSCYVMFGFDINKYGQDNMEMFHIEGMTAFVGKKEE